MGNVTSSLIESAIQSSNNEPDSWSDSMTTDSSKLELYRLLREKMADTDGDQKNPNATSGTDDSSSGGAAVSVLAPPAKEPAMMAPKKKFLIGFRGDESGSSGEEAQKATGPSADVVAAVPPTSSSTSAEVARSRSHTVSLPFRNRGPPQTQAEVPRRPLMESRPPADVVRSTVVTDSRGGTPWDSATPALHTDASASTMKSPRTIAIEPSARLSAVGHDVRSAGQIGYLSADRYQQALQQRLTPSGNTAASSSSSSYSPRGTQQHYHRDPAAVMEPGGGGGRQMTQYVRDRRPLMMSDTGLVEPGARHPAPLPPVREPRVVGITPVTTHPVVERQLDRRFFPPAGADRPPQPDRHFAVPPEYWRGEAVVDDPRRKVGARQAPEHREPRMVVGHGDPYVMSMSAQRSVDPYSERSLASSSHYRPADNRSLPPDQATASYPGHSAESARGWAGQHLVPLDSYRHGSGVVEFPTRESRTSRAHYDDARKYPGTEAQTSTAEYGAAADGQYNRHQLREPIAVQSTLEAEPRRPRPAPLQPVEPSVRPRIAGLTHGDPAVYEPSLPQFDSSRYPAEHAYHSSSGSKYELTERSRPVSDGLTQFVPVAEPKPVPRHSPYYPVTTRSSSGTSSVSLGTGSSAGSVRGESAAPRVTLESPLDLTVRKEQAMTAEAFLRRCQQDASQRSSQYTSPGRHTAELQYSGYQWPAAASEGFDPSLDMQQQSSYPRHVVQQPGDAVRQMHSAVGREYPPPPLHLEQADLRRFQQAPGSYPGQQHHRRPDDEATAADPHLMYARREPDPRWAESAARQPGPPMTPSHAGVKPAYWDVTRYATRPLQTNVELSESVANPRSHASTTTMYSGDVGWTGDRSQYGVGAAKATEAEPRTLGPDRRVHEVPLALSPQNVPTTAVSRRTPMVQLLGGKYSPNDILHLCCKVCSSTYGSLRSFRMHFAKAHGQEPTPENFTIQTISDARIQVAAMSQQVQETQLVEGASLRDTDLPPTLQIEESAMAVGRDVPAVRGEFAVAASMKPRSVAEVQPIQKAMASPAVTADPGPVTPVSKPPQDEATKRCGEDRRMKCKKCGQFSTPDLSALRQHVRSIHGAVETSASQWCECGNDTLDPDTGCVIYSTLFIIH